MEISCPKRLTEESVGRFLENASSYDSEELLSIRFDTIGWARPFGALYLASGLRRLRDRRESMSLRTRAHGHMSTQVGDYLAHVGFFHFLGIERGNAVGQARGSETYVPIREVERATFKATLKSDISEVAEELAEIIFDESSEMSAVAMLAYCFKEVLRNVFEHTDEESCFVMAQRWRDGRAEIAIVDEGPGVLSTLSPLLGPTTPMEALTMALKPGVTSGSTSENAGFGLYVLSDLGRRKGAFSIVSDDVGLLVGPSGVSTISAPFRGTAVRLLVDASDCDYFPNEFHRIIKEGERVAEDASRPAAASPSKVLRGTLELSGDRTGMTEEFGETLAELMTETQGGRVKWHEQSAGRYSVSFGTGIVEADCLTDSFHQSETFSARLTTLDGRVIIHKDDEQVFLGKFYAEARMSALDARSILDSFKTALEKGEQNEEKKDESDFGGASNADIPF